MSVVIINIPDDTNFYGEYDINNNLIYAGWAVPGSSNNTNLAIFKIQKSIYSGNNLIRKVWADGNTQYDNIWDNRAILSYS